MTQEEEIKGILVNFFRNGTKGDYGKALNYAIKEIQQVKNCSIIIQPNKLKEGQTALIKNWVNQPHYVGDKIRLENGKLIRTTKNGIDTVSVDMRYPYYCKVELL